MDNDASPEASRRQQITDDIKARTGIDEAMIERLVDAFYARVREDPLIGPIFLERVEDWNFHLEKLYAFWSSVALMSGRYHGRPMQVHLPLPINGSHFDQWLQLFEVTAAEICPPAAAAHFVERAYNIADSLEMGIASRRGEIRAPRRRPIPNTV
jgi:hemoglobin